MQTQTKLQYHVKHACGISTHYNSHLPEHPWHGAGAADAAPRWIVQADSMMQAYQSKATLMTPSNSNNNLCLQQGIDTFLDDTWMLNNGLPNQC